MSKGPAFEKLHAMISWGDFKAGTLIKEESVANLLGVSRTPVRAALFCLEDFGLIERTTGGSYAVRSFSEQDVLESLEIRVALEGLAARWLADRGCSTVEMDELERILTRLSDVADQEVSNGEINDCMRVSFDFFHVIAQHSRSRQIQEHLERINALPFVGLHGLRFKLNGALQSLLLGFLDDHRKILNAISERDLEGAKLVCSRRTRNIFGLIMQIYRSDQRPCLPGAEMIAAR